MKTLLKTATVFAFLLGGQVILLGALYKIQSWSPPVISGIEVDLLSCGIFLIIGGIALIIGRIALDFANQEAEQQEEQLDLSEEKLKQYAERPTPIAIEEEDLLL